MRGTTTFSPEERAAKVLGEGLVAFEAFHLMVVRKKGWKSGYVRLCELRIFGLVQKSQEKWLKTRVCPNITVQSKQIS